MSEVLRGWSPNAKEEEGVFSNHVESAAATSIAGQFSQPAANVFSIFSSAQRRGNGEHYVTRRHVNARDLQSPFQMIADVGFIVLLGLVVGAPFAFADNVSLLSEPSNLWNSMAIAAIILVLERASTSSSILGVTTRSTRFRQAVKIWTYGLAGFLFFEFIFKTSGELSRAYLASFYIAGLVAFGFWRALAAPAIARFGQKFGTTTSDLVVLGDTSRAGVHQFVDELSSGESGAFLVPLNLMCSEAEWPKEQQRVLSEACRALHGAKDAAVYLCSAGLSNSRLEGLCRSLSILPVGTYIVPDPATAGLARCRAFAVGNRVAFELRRPPQSRVQLFAKRMIDIVLGSIALVLLSPLMIAAAIAIRLDSDGPIFFRQLRTGQSGKPFRIFKFRTMYVLEDGPTIQQACRNDPRVTSVGRFLRASSIDELPQLFNVLNGEMSLVGPRPHAVAHDLHYAKEITNYDLRQHVKPGITGWAQVNGLRGETTSVELMHRRIEFDVWYALNSSLLLDIEIMARTVLEVCRPRNAY